MQLLWVFYHIAVTLLSFVAASIFLFFRRGRARIWERFGLWGRLPEEVLWIHGASLGEVSGLIPLLEALSRDKSAPPLLVSATSVTGLASAERFTPHRRLLPFDSLLFYAVALRRCKVAAALVSEKDLWPGMVHALRWRGVPVYFVNARRGRDEGGLQAAGRRVVLRSLLAGCRRVFAATERDAEVFRGLGVTADQLLIAGNTKYDREPASPDPALKARLFGRSKAPVLVLGSLRPEEERWWFDELARRFAAGEQLDVVVAPRHQEKFEYFARALSRAGLAFTRWSTLAVARDNGDLSKFTRVVLLDTYGLLEQVYAFANLAFIGGTLVDVGGHNPFEALQYGTCVCLGPHVRNISEVVEELGANEGYAPLSTPESVQELVGRLFTAPQSLTEMGIRGRAVWQRHHGAVQRIIQELSRDGVIRIQPVPVDHGSAQCAL